jgi:signal transduction histidine kinase/DNA-binding response OmpR family regulator/L-asparagine transporter-like permease
MEIEHGSTGMKNRTAPLGWIGIAALAFGGANQSLYMLNGLITGQSGIEGQGATSLLLLAGGFLLACLAAPGWLELVLMSPQRSGGIGAACGAAFRPYSPLLAALAGFCNWWGWAVTCGLGAITMARMIGPAFLPDVPLPVLSAAILAVLTMLALTGLRLAGGIAVMIALAVTGLACVSAIMPAAGGAFDFDRLIRVPLPVPFPGVFGQVTGVMAGVFLVGYAAPCLEAALCYVGKARQPARDTRRALSVVTGIGVVFFVALPVVWFGVLGAPGLSSPLNRALAPLFTHVAGLGHIGAVLLMTLCWVQTCIHALCGAPLTIAQLADDGMAPRILSRRTGHDVPVTATLMTAGVASALVLVNDTTWLRGAANFAYLIGIFLPSLAVWLLRRDQPDAARLYTAPGYILDLGLGAGMVWMLAALLGAEQFGLSIIVVGLIGAYSGAGVFAMRKLEDRRRAGGEGMGSTLYLDVMMALLIVVTLDGAGYIVALSRFGHEDAARAAELTDIFVAVALLSLAVSVVLPGRIAFATEMVGEAARKLAFSTLRDFSAALDSLGRGDLEGALMRAQVTPLPEVFDNELGELARNFNIMQAQVLHAAHGLENARRGLMLAHDELTATNEQLRAQVQEQERLAAELVVARDSATAGERSKTEFLAMMSHELRTPLNGVIGMAGLLLDGTLDAQSRIHAKMLRDAGDHLLEMINDLLDLTKLEASKIRFEQIGFDINAVVQSALDLVSARAHGKALGIGAFVAPDIPRALTGDPSRLRQVLINLLGNAVKFTARGHVLLEVLPVAFGEAEVTLRFAVTDTGIGIAEQDLPHLFEVFSQLDNSTSRRFGGTGLGLAISQRLVTGMGGRIGVDSKPAVGSTFHFELALKTGIPEAEAEDGFVPAPMRMLRGERVLVLHGDTFGGRLMGRQIESRGGKVALTNSIPQAFSLIRSPPGKGFDAVVVDQSLPYGGAGKFAGQLRADKQVSGLRMILTGTSEGSAEPAGNDLFDARLMKPVPLDTLIEKLVPAGAEQAAPEPKAEPVQQSRRLRILVAEDNHTNQAVIRAMLAKLEHSVDMVGNGVRAVEAVQERSYDLVLMDMMMPELDGIGATKQIRALGGRASRVPIIALTADVSAENHVVYRAAGIQSVLTKPITLRALAAALDGVEVVTAYARTAAA